MYQPFQREIDVQSNTFSIDDLQSVYFSTRNPVFRQNIAVIRSVMKGCSTADICDFFVNIFLSLVFYNKWVKKLQISMMESLIC